jgi:porphobilinogen deaminase
MSKGESIVELKSKNTTTTIKDITPVGVRLEFNSEREVKGSFNAAHMETVSVLAKSDGTNEWEAKIIEMTKDGDMVIAMSKGTGRQESPTVGRFEGDVTFQTSSKKLAWLNTTKRLLRSTPRSN